MLGEGESSDNPRGYDEGGGRGGGCDRCVSHPGEMSVPSQLEKSVSPPAKLCPPAASFWEMSFQYQVDQGLGLLLHPQQVSSAGTGQKQQCWAQGKLPTLSHVPCVPHGSLGAQFCIHF